MESMQLQQRAELKNYPKRMIDRSPASPTFLQRKLDSNVYENVVCPEIPASSIHTNSSMATNNYTVMSSHIPAHFSTANEREKEMSPETYGSQRSLAVFNAYCNIDKSGHFHQMSGSLSSNSLCRYDAGESMLNQCKQRVPLPSCVPSNYTNCNSNVHTDEDRDTSPIFRPRSNTAPSRRRPLLGNALARGTAENLQQSGSVQCSCETISCYSHFVPQGAETRGENLNRLVASHSPQTSSLPGSPKNLPRRTSLPNSWKSERSQTMNARNNSKGGSLKGNTSVQFCPSCAQIAQTLPTGWEVKETSEGLPYFIDHNTRSTHWRLPWLPACLPCDLLQKAYLENNAEVARDAMMVEESTHLDTLAYGSSLEQITNVMSTAEYPPPSGANTAPLVPPRQPVKMQSKLSINRGPLNTATIDRQLRGMEQHVDKLPSAPARTLLERLRCETREIPSRTDFKFTSNYIDKPPQLIQSFNSSNASGFAAYNQAALPCEMNDASVILYDPIAAFDDNYVKFNSELKPLKPLTRLPNALPLDVAVAAERSRRVIDTYKPEVASPLSPQAPKRPEHPSVESQLVYLLNAQPDFFMDAYYKGDDKLDRMIDFKLFDCSQLEVMRDSMDKLYFAECQSTCAAYERYRLALTEKIKHKLGLQLKEKHKRQLNHIRNCAANASASSRSSSSEALDSTLEANQNFIQQNDDTASLSSDLSRVQLSDSC